jgi:oligosaccharide repeat unit polymerase
MTVNLHTLNTALKFCSLVCLGLLAQLSGVVDLADRVQAFVASYLLISSLFIICYSRKESLDFFSPGIGLVVLLFLYSLSSALFVESTGVTAHNDPVGERTITIYYYSCIAGLAGLSCGMLWAQRFNSRPIRLLFESKILLHNKLFYRKLLAAVIVLSVLLCSKILPWFNFTKVESYAMRSTAVRVERMENAAAGMQEAFLVNLPIMLILCLATYLLFKKRNLFFRGVGFFIIASYLVRNTMAGWRGHVMAALIIPAIYYHYRVRRISTTFAITSGVLVYLFVNVMSFVRSTSALGEMYELLDTAFRQGNLKFLSLTSSTELLVGTNLHRLISGIENMETSFTYGGSIISEFLVFIPRFFYSARPLSLSENFAATFYPGALEEGAGFGFFFLQEGYWAAGIAGVFMLTFVYGWMTQMIYQWVRRNVEHDIVPFMYAAVYNVLVLSAVRTGLFGNFKNVLMVLLPFLFVVIMPTLKIRQIFARKSVF